MIWTPFIWNKKNLLEHNVYGWKEIIWAPCIRIGKFHLSTLYMDRIILYEHLVLDGTILPGIWMCQFYFSILYMDEAILFQHPIHDLVNFISTPSIWIAQPFTNLIWCNPSLMWFGAVLHLCDLLQPFTNVICCNPSIMWFGATLH